MDKFLLWILVAAAVVFVALVVMIVANMLEG